MYAEFSFLEYTYNPDDISPSVMHDVLSDLGFVKYSQHVSGRVSLWSQGICLLFVRQSNTCKTPGISGLGFIISKDAIRIMNLTRDEDSEFYLGHDPDGNRVLFLTPDMLTSNTSSLFSKYEKSLTDTTARIFLNTITGVLINISSHNTIEFYKDLGFKITKEGDNFITFVSNNNRFSIVASIQPISDVRVYCAIFDTDDIFNATSYFTYKDVQLKKYNNSCEYLEFGNLNHKICGYNCIAFGNEDSYSIENFSRDALPNMDMIFRMRKQYLHITENTLKTHYEE